MAEDSLKSCKTGDLVVITKLEQQVKREITHSVTERVLLLHLDIKYLTTSFFQGFRLGDVKDPISGEMVVGTQYR